MKDPRPSLQAVTSSIMDYTKAKAKQATEISTEVVLSLLSSVLTVVLVVTVSVFLYGTFYYAYVPIDVHQAPLDLEFSPCEQSSMKCSYPRAQLTLGRQIKLNPRQSYSLRSRLTLPDNSVNEEHGMFMTCLTISSVKRRLRQSCKSSILQYRSALLRALQTLAFLPALLTGVTAQNQEVIIDFFDKIELDPHNLGHIITLEIRSKHLEVSAASLDIYADLRGLKFLMYRYPWVSMLLGVGTNILLLSSILLISWTRLLSPVSVPRANDECESLSRLEEIQQSDRLSLLKTVIVALIVIILLISGSSY